MVDPLAKADHARSVPPALGGSATAGGGFRTENNAAAKRALQHSTKGANIDGSVSNKAAASAFTLIPTLHSYPSQVSNKAAASPSQKVRGFAAGAYLLYY